MSTRKQIVDLEKQLNETNDIFIKGIALLREVADSVDELGSDDYDKAEETSGAVAIRLEKQSEKLEIASNILGCAIDDIESASGDALYALQEIK